MEELRKFARYFTPYKWSILSGILFILVSMAFGLFIPYLIGQAVDDLGQQVTWNKVLYYPLVILGINSDERRVSLSAAPSADKHFATYRV